MQSNYLNKTYKVNEKLQQLDGHEHIIKPLFKNVIELLHRFLLKEWNM